MTSERDLRLAAIILGGVGMMFSAYYSIDTVAQGAMGMLLGFGVGAGVRKRLNGRKEGGA